MAHPTTRPAPLPHSTPEAQGIPSAAIAAFVAAAERELDAMHSFIIVRHGQVVAEKWWAPYEPADQHMLFSLSKSFTSTAIGLLVAEGRLTVDDPVLSFFPDDAPEEPSEHLRAMRVRHLLSMSTGHTVDTTGFLGGVPGRTWTQGFLAQPVERAPGTHFLYNSGATYMLSAIVQKLTGGRLLDYLGPRLFAPLGIANPRWDTSPEGIDVGGWGLWITTGDIAAFGQLYLQKGFWQGQQLIPEAWVEEATARQMPNGPANPDWEQGYGYQFWRCRHDAYRGDGAFGQFCVVLPDQQAVIAITSGLRELQRVLDLVWEHLLPALGADPLPDTAESRAIRDAALAPAQLPTPPGAATTPTAARIIGQRFVMDANADGIVAISVDFADDGATLTIENGHGAQRLVCGHGTWRRGEVSLGPLAGAGRPAAPRGSGPWKVGASGAWADDATYVAKLWWYETPFARTLTFRFDGNRLALTHAPNVVFGEVEETELNGELRM